MTDAETSGPAPTIEQLRESLEGARAAYHELAASLGEDDWKVKSANEAWTIGQQMWHIAWAVQFSVAGADSLRGRKQWSPPRSIYNMINPWLARLSARGANKESVTKKYDDGHDKVMAALESVSQDDLSRTAMQLGEEHTVAYYFQAPARHLEEHQRDILQALGRP